MATMKDKIAFSRGFVEGFLRALPGELKSLDAPDVVAIVLGPLSLVWMFGYSDGSFGPVTIVLLVLCLMTVGWKLAILHAAPKAKRQREENPRTVKQQGIEALGAKNAARVEHATAAIDQIVASEAARAGWLGDVDFTVDLNGIIGNLRKAHDLRKVADQLSGLDKPSADDRKILVEAKAAIETLEGAAVERVKLIEKCATEARLVDESLQKERDDARTEEQRAELHAKLSVMLYGIKATPDATSTETATDAVIARVCAYREIKNEIQHVRDNSL
jgi:hypothetical protein